MPLKKNSFVQTTTGVYTQHGEKTKRANYYTHNEIDKDWKIIYDEYHIRPTKKTVEREENGHRCLIFPRNTHTHTRTIISNRVSNFFFEFSVVAGDELSNQISNNL